MCFYDRVQKAFPQDKMPENTVDAVDEFNNDCDDAYWFVGKARDTLTWSDWQLHIDSIWIFNKDAFLYYLPSIIFLSYQKTDDRMQLVESFFYALAESAHKPEIAFYENRVLNSISIEQWYVILEWATALSRNEYYCTIIKNWIVIFEYIIKIITKLT